MFLLKYLFDGDKETGVSTSGYTISLGSAAFFEMYKYMHWHRNNMNRELLPIINYSP